MQTWGREISSFGLCFPAIDDYILNCTTREIYSIHSSFLLIFRVIWLLHRHFYLVCWFTFEQLENQESQWNNFHSFSTMAQVFFSFSSSVQQKVIKLVLFSQNLSFQSQSVWKFEYFTWILWKLTQIVNTNEFFSSYGCRRFLSTPWNHDSHFFFL